MSNEMKLTFDQERRALLNMYASDTRIIVGKDEQGEA